MMTDFFEHKVSQSSFVFLCEKPLRLYVKVYTEIHRDFMNLIALKRDTLRRFTFYLRSLRKNLATLRLNFTHCLNLSLIFALAIDNVSLN